MKSTQDTSITDMVGNRHNTNSRISYITFLYSFAVMLVVLGHSFLPDSNFQYHYFLGHPFPYQFSGDTYSFFPAIIQDIIHSFHMPLFFALAGFLFIHTLTKNNMQINIISKLKSKFLRLMLPYISIGTIIWLLKIFIFNKFAYHPLKSGFSDFCNYFFFLNQVGFLWFLPTILIIYFIAFSFYRLFTKKNITIIVIMSLIISIFSVHLNFKFFGIDKALYNLFYFCFGSFLYFYQDIFTKNRWFLSILFIMSSILSFYIGFENILMKIPLAISGILFSFSLAHYLDGMGYKFFGGIIDGEYYQIYLLSWFAQQFVGIFYKIGIVNYIICSILMFFVPFIFTKIICFIVNKYFAKLKVFIGM